jgi:phosphomannomutase
MVRDGGPSLPDVHRTETRTALTAKRLIVFDLDGTLAPSKGALDAEMAALLGALLGVVQVAVISGGDWPQFQQQLISQLPAGAPLQRLSILPTSGTKFFRYAGAWKCLYSEDFTTTQRDTILAALEQAIGLANLRIDKVWGEATEDRGSQITWSALGQRAPGDAKAAWDPDFAKRRRLKALLDPLIPGFSVRLGGATSIDITAPGVDKAYGIAKLRDVLGIALDEMMFVGDALFPGGNDYPAEQAGVVSIHIRDPNETKRVVEAITACLDLARHAAPTPAGVA